MAKTKQIGVRFDSDLLISVNLTPQKALNLYQESHIELLKIKANDHLCKVKITEQPKDVYDAEKVDLKNLDEAGQWEQPKIIETPKYPKDFNALLKMAKGEIENKEEFIEAVSVAKINMNQKTMILAKLK